MNREEFDKLFDEAFNEAAKNSTIVPDFTPSWERIQSNIKRKRSRQKIKVLLPISVASFFLGAILFGSPSITKAFDPFFANVKNIQQSVVSFVFGSSNKGESGALTAPPDDSANTDDGIEPTDSSIIETSYPSWDEALQHIALASRFDYIPSDYSLTEVRLYSANKDSKAYEARLIYHNNKKQRFMIKLSKLKENEVITSSHVQGDGEYEIVQINNSNGYYFMTSTGQAMLEFLNAGTYISISGELSKEQFIQTAQNIK